MVQDTLFAHLISENTSIFPLANTFPHLPLANFPRENKYSLLILYGTVSICPYRISEFLILNHFVAPQREVEEDRAQYPHSAFLPTSAP